MGIYRYIHNNSCHHIIQVTPQPTASLHHHSIWQTSNQAWQLGFGFPVVALPSPCLVFVNTMSHRCCHSIWVAPSPPTTSFCCYYLPDLKLSHCHSILSFCTKTPFPACIPEWLQTPPSLFHFPHPTNPLHPPCHLFLLPHPKLSHHHSVSGFWP